MQNGPLTGLRVVEVTQGATGAFCAMQLADLGADVVKVEALEGDKTRALAHRRAMDLRSSSSGSTGTSGVQLWTSPQRKDKRSFDGWRREPIFFWRTWVLTGLSNSLLTMKRSLG